MISGTTEQVQYFLSQAVAKHRKGQTEAAIDLYLKSLDLEASLPDWVYENIIILLSQVGRISDALKLKTYALKFHFQSDKVYRAIGFAFHQQGDFVNSITYYWKTLEISQDQPEWLYSALVEMLVDADQVRRAIEIGHLGLKFHDNCGWLNYHLAKALAMEEQWAEAIFYYTKAAQIKPDIPNIRDKINLAIESAKNPNKKLLEQKSCSLQNQALAKQQEGQIEAAIALYLESVELNIQQPAWVYENLITLLAQAGQLEQALSLREKALENHPLSEGVYRAIGLAFNQQGDWTSSISCYLQTLEISEQQPDWLYSSVVEMLVDSRQVKRAIEIGDLGLKFHGDCGWLNYHLAEALSVEENWTKAIFYYAKAVVDFYSRDLSAEAEIPNIQEKINFAFDQINNIQELLPKETILPEEETILTEEEILLEAKYSELNTKAVSKHKEGKTEEAIALYLEAIQLYENQAAWVYGNAITLLAEVTNFDQALELGEKALHFHSESDEIYRAIGIVYEGKQDTVNCIKYYEKAISLEENQPDWLYFNLAKQLLQNNDIDRVIEISKQGIKLYGINIYKSSYHLYRTLGLALKARDKNNSESRTDNDLTLEFAKDSESEFDWQFYIQYYEDVSHFSSYEEAFQHWIEHGQQENRICSAQQFYASNSIDRTVLPADFDWQEYLELNADLQPIISLKWQAIQHFLLNGIQEARLYSYKQLYYNQLYYEAPQDSVTKNPDSDEPSDQELTFDWQFYVDYNQDISYLDSYEKAYQHWIDNGKKENRICAEKQLYQVHGLQKSDLPADFDWQEYITLHIDLQAAIKTKWVAITHYMTIGIKEGRIYRLEQLKTRPDVAPKSLIKENLLKNAEPAKQSIFKRISQNFFNRASPKADSWEVSTTESQGKRLAVLFHLYYFDLWPEISNYLRNIEEEFDLFINIVESIWQPEIHDQLRQDFPNARIIISKNNGKDIGGQLASMGQLDFSQYDIFCLCHTKKSPHISQVMSDQWRKDLYDAILGSPEKVRINLEVMRNDSSVGLIGSRYWRNTEVLNNTKYYQQLLDEFEIKPEARDCEYLSGTMMFVRPQIMKIIYDKYGNVELENGDGASISFQKDGQIAHAIERIIGNLVRNQGMRFFWQD